MTPAARVAAAAEVLDAYLDGVPAEKALLAWSRGSRYAGSKDRRAVRDHVFQALRCLRSYAALGGAPTGRALMIGALRAEGRDAAQIFSGEGHAPLPLSADEEAQGRPPLEGAEASDIPDWLWPEFCASLGEDAEQEAQILRQRAPVYLRVNARKASVSEAAARLRQEGVETRQSQLATHALEATDGAQKIKQTEAYLSGWIELQDAASQAVCEMLPLAGAERILDYCAGGGGKSLALAAISDAQITAHDIASKRMKDIPERAARAGVQIAVAEKLGDDSKFDLVFCDAPCSGSGAWRRAPEGKWQLNEAALERLTQTQNQVLVRASRLVAAGGALGYATCSVLARENEQIVEQFLAANPHWTCAKMRRWRPSGGGDGFFCAIFARV